MRFEDLAKVVEMLFSDIFDAKVIHYETEHDWLPSVMPKAWRGGGFVVAGGIKLLPEEVVGKYACLKEAIASTDYFKVYPAFTLPHNEVVLVDEHLGYICKLDVDIL